MMNDSKSSYTDLDSTMQFLSSFIIFFLLSTVTNISVATESVSLANTSAILVDYVNSFATVGDIRRDLLSRGFLSNEENADVGSFLAEKNISNSSKLIRARANGNTILWNEVSLTLKNGDLKGTDGGIFRYKKGVSFRANLAKVWFIVSPHKNVSVFNFFVNQSFASARDQLPAESTAFLAAIGYVTAQRMILESEDGTIEKTARSLGHAIFSVAGYADGGVRRLLWPARNVLGGKIHCDSNGRYIAEVLDYATWSEGYEFWKKNPDGIKMCKNTHLVKGGFCAFLNANMEFNESFKTTGKSVLISDETLKKIFPSSDGKKKCDQLTALMVRKYLESQVFVIPTGSAKNDGTVKGVN